MFWGAYFWGKNRNITKFSMSCRWFFYFLTFSKKKAYRVIIYISVYKWFTTHRVLKSYKSKMDVICMQSWLSPPLPCGNSCTWIWCSRTSCAQVHELPQGHHCGDNREDTFFSWLDMVFLVFYSICSLSLLHIFSHFKV